MTEDPKGRTALGVLTKKPVLLVLALLIGLLLGRGFSGSSGPPTSSIDPDHPAGESTQSATIWTCSMHPQIRLPEPGQCPICFMDLIPLETGPGDDSGLPRLVLSETARALAEIETAPVIRDRPFVEVPLVGKVDYDETRISAITAWVPGRLDRLYVDYTGIQVRKGDHVAEMYSPELLTAAEELIQAIQTRRSTGRGSRLLDDAADATIKAAREKLRLLGVTPRQIEDIEKGKATATDHVTLFTQSAGVVIEKNAVEGDYVQTGTVIYRIADLSQVWIQLDAYESDLVWIRYGQEVEFVAEALPGRVFHGKVVFISPTLDPGTRTVKVRVHADNERGLLKPEMFVRAEILAEVAQDGGVVLEGLEGQWICPMHPEVVEDGPGSCRVCGMDLVPAADLGYATATDAGSGPLVIPMSAILFTGKRAIVYVEDPDADSPTYEGREILLGPRAGDRYLVMEGLAEGERVVVNGNFKIDSALQIQAKPSMMSPKPAGVDRGSSPGAKRPAALASGEFVAGLTPLYDTYLDVWRALAGDDDRAAGTGFASLHEVLHSVKEDGLSARDRQEWRRLAKNALGTVEGVADDAGIDAHRRAFGALSETVVEILRQFGHAEDTSLYLTFCPMAFDFEGAHWLQDRDRIANPYFGASMPRCGEVQEEFVAAGKEGR